MEMPLELKGHTRGTDSEVTVKALGVGERAQGSPRIMMTAEKINFTGGREDAIEKGHWVPTIGQ